MMKKHLNRAFLLLGVTLAAVLPTIVAQAQGSTPQPQPGQQQFFSDPEATDAHCGYTDETTSGPYYISGAPETDNLNYQNAEGTPLVVTGVAYDGSTGEPIANAQVEVWHADPIGDYHPAAQGDAADFNAADLNLRAIVTTDDTGTYKFSTIEPGIYEGRRRHIHYYVTAPGYLPLFTQTYWQDDPNAEIDMTDADTEPCRVLTFATADDGRITGTFDIYLRPDPNFVATEEVTEVAQAVTCTRLNLNDLTEAALTSTIPNFPNRMVREFFEYRPYVSIQQYRREIGKYVGDTQTAEWEQYIYVPVDPNNADAETLKQLPGVDDTIAADLAAGRPYASNDAFLQALGARVDSQQLAEASCYLATSS